LSSIVAGFVRVWEIRDRKLDLIPAPRAPAKVPADEVEAVGGPRTMRRFSLELLHAATGPVFFFIRKVTAGGGEDLQIVDEESEFVLEVHRSPSTI
jgi:hypothetical protein